MIRAFTGKSAERFLGRLLLVSALAFYYVAFHRRVAFAMILRGFKMEELKRFCSACQQEREIVLIEKHEDGGMTELSCGHKNAEGRAEIKAIIEILVSYRAKQKKAGFKNYARRTTQRFKISGETKRKAKELLIIDKEKNIKIHRILEQDESGRWVLVHYEREPLDKKKA